MVRQAILDGILGPGHGFLYNSFIKKNQELLLDAILEHKIYPNLSIATKLKEKGQNEELSEEIIKRELLGKIEPRKSVVISEKLMSQYFPEDYSSEDIEKVIIELLEKWNRGIIKKK